MNDEYYESGLDRDEIGRDAADEFVLPELPIWQRPWFIASVVVAAMILVAVGAFGAMSLSGARKKAGTTAAMEKNNATALAEVKKLFPYILPSEAPTVATVTDVSKLAGQDFFGNAQNGDTLLVYPTSHVAIIYRSAQHAVVNFGSTSAQNTLSTGSSSSAVGNGVSSGLGAGVGSGAGAGTGASVAPSVPSTTPAVLGATPTPSVAAGR